MLNLDTHIVIFFLEGSLTGAERDLVRGRRLGISCIVLWELAKLKQLGRLAFGPDDPEVADFLKMCIHWPIDVPVAIQSTKMDFRGDPADEIIAATSVVYGVPLLTRDKRIRASAMVPLADAEP